MTSKQLDIDIRYMKMAAIVAENSYCVKRKVGALIVKDRQIISEGYNGTPSGFENVCEIQSGEELKTKPYVLHAESNAILKVATSTQTTVGATLYITCSPCIECSKLIIQAKISRVVYQELHDEDGIELLKRAGVEVCNVDTRDKIRVALENIIKSRNTRELGNFITSYLSTEFYQPVYTIYEESNNIIIKVFDEYTYRKLLTYKDLLNIQYVKPV